MPKQHADKVSDDERKAQRKKLIEERRAQCILEGVEKEKEKDHRVEEMNRSYEEKRGARNRRNYEKYYDKVKNSERCKKQYRKRRMEKQELGLQVLFTTKDQIAQRTCLRCDKKFESKGIENRICPYCTRKSGRVLAESDFSKTIP